MLFWQRLSPNEKGRHMFAAYVTLPPRMMTFCQAQSCDVHAMHPHMTWFVRCVARYEWLPPLGGSGVDEFQVSEDGQTLTIATTMHVAQINRHCSYRWVSLAWQQYWHACDVLFCLFRHWAMMPILWAAFVLKLALPVAPASTRNFLFSINVIC